MTKNLNRKLRFAVLGLGFGASVHIPAIKSNPNINLIAVYSRNLKKAKKYAHENNIKYYFSSIEKILNLDLDAVTIALPPKQSENAIQKVIKRNIHILTEKPFTHNLQKALKFVKQSSNKVTCVDYIFYELETFKCLKKLIETKKYGDVQSIKVDWIVESWVNKKNITSWKTSSHDKGGVLSLLGNHLIFLAEWFFGPITSLRANSKKINPHSFYKINSLNAEDTLNLEFNHGKINFKANLSNANPKKNIHRWKIIFDKKIIFLENKKKDYVGGFILFEKGKNNVINEIIKEKNPDNDGRILPFSNFLSNFVNSIHHKKQLFPNFETGARIQVIDDLIRKSCTTNKKIYLK